MRLAIIGFGQAGGKVLDEFLAYDRNTKGTVVSFPLAINSASSDLNGLDEVPPENRILIGQSRVKGHGVGTDNQLGYEIAAEDMDELQAAIDDIPVHEIDAFLLVAGLGGGTGSGGAPVLAKRLRTLYAEPVYGLGILPGRDEGRIYSLNAARSVQTLVRETDNLLLFDNDAWRTAGESISSGFDQINREIVKRFGVLFSSGEVSSIGESVGESVVDASEVINTLGTGGLSAVGFASAQLDTAGKSGLLGRLSGGTRATVETASGTNRIVSLVRSAALGRLTVPCDIERTERALLVVAGPPEFLDRKGIERSRRWLEEATDCPIVRGGDYPVTDSNYVAAVVLLSGISGVERIAQLTRAAGDTADSIEDQQRHHDGALADLFEDSTVDPLF